MKRNLTIAQTLGQIKSFEERFRDKNETLIGIFFVKLWGWELDYFVPTLFLSDKSIYLLIGKSFSSVKLPSIKTSGISSIKEKNKPARVTLEYGDEKIILSLVSIDDKLETPNTSYTKDFYTLLKSLLNNKKIGPGILEKLPNQMFSGYRSQRSLPLIIASLLMVTLGFVLQPYNFSIAWFFLLGGLIMGLIGIIIAISKKQLL